MAGEAASGARSFIIDNIFVGLAQFLTKFRGLILIPLLVKGLGIESYGIYVQVLSFVGLAGGLLALNLHLPLVQFLAESRSSSGNLLATLQVSVLASVGAGALLLYLAAGPGARDALVGTDDTVVFGAALLIAVAAGSRVFLMNAYRATDRIKLRTVIEFLGTLVELAGAVALVVSGYGMRAVLGFTAAWGLAFDVACFVHVARLLGLGRFDLAILVKALRYSVPLVPASVAAWALDRGDRFLLNVWRGEKEVGIYSAQYAWAALASAVLLPLQVTLVPKVAKLWATQPDEARRYLETSMRVFLMSAIGGCAILISCAPPALQVLASAEVAVDSRTVVALVSVGSLLWGATILQSLVFYSTHQTARVGMINAAAAVINLVANLVCIPRWGIRGAAVATALGYSGAFILTLAMTRSYYGFLASPRFVLGSITAALAAGALAAGLVAQEYPLLAAPLAGAAYGLGLLLLGVVRRDEVVAAASRLRRAGPRAER